MSRVTNLTDFDLSVQGVLNTISDRLDGADPDELVEFALAAEGDRAFKNIADSLPDLDLYFSALYEDGSEQAAELFGDSDYAREIGRPIDQVEDAFVAWSLDRPLLAPTPTPGPRGRLSGLAERQLSLV